MSYYLPLHLAGWAGRLGWVSYYLPLYLAGRVGRVGWVGYYLPLYLAGWVGRVGSSVDSRLAVTGWLTLAHFNLEVFKNQIILRFHALL